MVTADSAATEPAPGHEPTGLGVTRLAGYIGAEIQGVDAATELTDAVVAQLRQALLTHKVVFLRNQSLDYAQLAAFAAWFGPLTPGHRIYRAPDVQPHVRDMDSRGDGTRANYWHTDLTFVAAPPTFAFLHNLVCPPLGGDTIWANTAAAYAALPPEVQALADGMRVVHSNNSCYTDATYVHNPTAPAEYIERRIEAEQPVTRVHPETGERSLLLGRFARSVVGHQPRSGRDLLRVLEDYATQPECTVRWRWQTGDLGIWDNQSSMHYAVLDYGSEHRHGIRVTVEGRHSVGVDGRPSIQLHAPGGE